jgi:hypothetical protein
MPRCGEGGSVGATLWYRCAGFNDVISRVLRRDLFKTPGNVPAEMRTEEESELSLLPSGRVTETPTAINMSRMPMHLPLLSPEKIERAEKSVAVELPSDIDPALAVSSEEVADEALTPESVSLGLHKLNSAAEPVSIVHSDWRLELKLLGSGVRSFLEASCCSPVLSLTELVPLGFGPDARATFSRCRSIGPYRFSVSSFAAVGLQCAEDGSL